MAISDVLFSLSGRKEASRFRLSDDTLAMRVGLTLAGIVGILIFLHVFFEHYSMKIGTGGFASSMHNLFDIGKDNSLPETFNHGMLFFSAVLFLLVSYETKSRVALFLVAVFAFAWFDDSAQYHERMGTVFAQNLNLPSAFGLRAQDFGELLAWGLAAILLSFLAIWAYVGRLDGDGVLLRLVSLPLATLLLCAVAFDMVHIMVQAEWADRLLTVLEDGGEMLAVAAIATVALAVARNPGSIWYRKPL